MAALVTAQALGGRQSDARFLVHSSRPLADLDTQEHWPSQCSFLVLVSSRGAPRGTRIEV